MKCFTGQGLRVNPSAKPKAQIYTECLPLLNGHRASLIEHSRLISQLCALVLAGAARPPIRINPDLLARI